MSVYEQIACRTRQRKIFADNDEVTNDDNQTSMIFQVESFRKRKKTEKSNLFYLVSITISD